jgi:tetratricopeptide (TPR) repeat protein
MRLPKFRFRQIVLSALVAALASAPAHADEDHDNAVACETGSGQAAVDACTWLVNYAGTTPERRILALHKRAVHHADMNQFHEEVADYDQLVALLPNYAPVFALRGLAHKDAGEFEAGIADFDRSITLDPVASTYLYRGTGYAALRKFDLALADLDKAIALKPTDANLYNTRCYIRINTNLALDQALADCNESLRLAPGDAMDLTTRAMVFLRQGDFAHALVDATAAFRADQKSADALFARGLARIRLGDADGGNIDMAAAAVIDPQVRAAFADVGLKP